MHILLKHCFLKNKKTKTRDNYVKTIDSFAISFFRDCTSNHLLQQISTYPLQVVLNPLNHIGHRCVGEVYWPLTVISHALPNQCLRYRPN